MTETDDKVSKALARFDRVMAVVDEKQGPIASQARAERQRTIRRYGRATRNAALALIGHLPGARARIARTVAELDLR